MDSKAIISGLPILGQPALTSIYDPTGTAESEYGEAGPYSCRCCVHKTAADEPFCVHPKVIGDPQLQDRLTMINNRPTIKIDLNCGCCRYVRPPAPIVTEP
jgi:hypothetical protein